MSIPSLADHLAGVAVVVAGGEKLRGRVHTLDGSRPAKPASLVPAKAVPPEAVRVHRIATPEEDADPVFPPFAPIKPVIAPSPTPEGGPMPRGHYPRKPKVDAAPPDLSKPLRKKPAKKRNGVKHRALPVKVGDASFVIDDRGRMRIKDGQQEISLERADVQRLTVFLERTKTIRA